MRLQAHGRSPVLRRKPQRGLTGFAMGWLAASPLGCALVLSGCSLVTTMWGPPPGFASPPDRPFSRTGLLDLRGVFHCHSHHSHDSDGTIEEIAAACESVGMDFLVMSDHPSPESVSGGTRGTVGDTLFIVGAEIRTPGGTLLAFPLVRPLGEHATVQGYLEEIHRVGALAFVGHAERFTAWEQDGLDGVEIHNLHAAAVRSAGVWVAIKAVFAPLETLFTSLVDLDPEVLERWDEGQNRGLLTAVGGHDAHANLRVLGSLGWVIGNYEEVFRVMSTHVLATGRDEAAIIDALRQGRTYVVFDLWRDGSGFAFWAEDGEDVREMGSVVSSGATLRVQSPVPAEIFLLRNGEVVASTSGEELRFEDPEPGVYRVEVQLDDDPWIVSSAIRVGDR